MGQDFLGIRHSMILHVHLGEADVFVFVKRRGVPALEDVVDGQGCAPAVVDAPGVADRLTCSINSMYTADTAL